MSEQDRLNQISQWYSNRQWGFYTQIVDYCYLSLKPYFKPGNLLEVGPADGEMTRFLLQDFTHISVVDGAKKYVDQVMKMSPHISGYVSMIETFKAPELYDNIMMAHILEHLSHPVQVLKKVKSLLKPHGRLFIVVPNANSLHRQVGVAMGLLRRVTELNDADRSVNHHRVYTISHLKRHCRQSHLKLIVSGGILLKPISSAQIHQQWSPELIAGYYELGKKYPHLCSEIYVICESVS
jgi:2-polyprenyl-3-methyl-5-hydroxy-6-metoxy-1,4-benzoquinol methylase